MLSAELHAADQQHGVAVGAVHFDSLVLLLSQPTSSLPRELEFGARSSGLAAVQERTSFTAR